MEKILIYITKMASHTRLDISDIRARTLKILTDHGYIFSDNGPVKSAFINYRTSLAEFITAVERLSVLTGLDHKDFLPKGPNWIENNLQTTSRWLAGVADAPAWCRWRLAVVEADNIGLTPLIGAIDNGKVTGAELEAFFEFAYVTWWANCVANDDDILSSFLVEDHENKINAFVRADQRVSGLSKKIARARISGSVPSMTGSGSEPEWGTLSREIQ